MALLVVRLLDCRPEDIGFREGKIVNETGPEHALTYAEVAITNAALDALSGTGVRHLDAPLSAEKVWRALQEKVS